MSLIMDRRGQDHGGWGGPDPLNIHRKGRKIMIIIIIRSRGQQRSVASTQSGHDDEPWTIRHETWRVYRSRSAGSMNGAGVLSVTANQDQSGGQFLLLRPVIMRGGLACECRVSPHGRTMNFALKWPLKCHIIHSKLLLDNSTSFASWRMKDVSKTVVKLIFRGAWNSLMAWPDWPWPSYFTTDLYATDG